MTLDDDLDDDDLDLEDTFSGIDIPIDDLLDLDVVDEFNEEDFDEDFDDEFEEEVIGEYDLEDDQYGEDFDDQFGHLTDPQAKPAAKKRAAGGDKKGTGKKKEKGS